MEALDVPPRHPPRRARSAARAGRSTFHVPRQLSRRGRRERFLVEVAGRRRSRPGSLSRSCDRPPSPPVLSFALARDSGAGCALVPFEWTGDTPGGSAPSSSKTTSTECTGDDLAHPAAGLDDHARLWRGDRHGGLVGHDLDDRLVLDDYVPGLHEPRDDLPLGDPLTDIRQLELPPCHLALPRTWPSRRARAECGARAVGTPSRASTEREYRSRTRAPAAPRDAGRPARSPA